MNELGTGWAGVGQGLGRGVFRSKRSQAVRGIIEGAAGGLVEREYVIRT